MDLMGRLSNPGKDFVQVSDKGVRDHGSRRDLDVECVRQLAAGNRQTQIRLGPAAIERLIDAYAAGSSVFQLAARFNIHRTTVLAHLERNGFLDADPVRSSATRTSTKQPSSIVTSSR